MSQVNLSQLANLSGKNRATVKSWLEKAGIKPLKSLSKEVVFDSVESLTVLFGQDAPGSEKVSELLLKQQLKHETARVKLVEHQLSKLKSEVVPIEEVARTVAKEYTYVRAALLSIPSKRAMALALEDDPAKINDMLKDDINEVLAHLSADTDYSEKYQSPDTESEKEQHD